jgi:D-alanine-D-alanine ligase
MITVGVLRGGPSSEYEVSLKTGAAVLRNLDTEKYRPLDILIDKEGLWHARGREIAPARILCQLDVVFNAMHGEYGEDGTVQKLLSTFGIPYTGSGALASALCMNKLATKERLRPFAEDVGFKLARHAVLNPSGLYEDLPAVFDELGGKVVVKPLIGGSSVGVSIADDFSEFKEAIVRALTHAPKVLVEEYISGKEATCGVLEGFRGEELYAMLPIEIVPPSDCRFFDYEAKYSGRSQEICPGNFSSEEKNKLENLACAVHEVLGLRHYSRSDFILGQDGIYFLEVNTLPGLTEESLVPKALKAVGCEFPAFLDHLISLAALRRVGV